LNYRQHVVRSDVSLNRGEGFPSSVTYSASGYAPRIPLVGVGVSASASLWTQDDRRALSTQASVSRNLGTLYAQAGYQYYQTEMLATSLETHGVEALLQVPLTRTIGLVVQGSAHFGQNLTGTRLYSSLWVRL
jgi:hypothetical protein